MNDLEKVKQYHDWLGDKYEVSDPMDKNDLDREGVDCNQQLVVGAEGSWYWIYYNFKDGKLVNHYTSE